MKYLVAVQTDQGNEIFEFNTKEDRARFIEEIEDKVKGWATSEIDDLDNK